MVNQKNQGKSETPENENEQFYVNGAFGEIGQGKEKGKGKGKKGPLSAQQLAFRNLCGKSANNCRDSGKDFAPPDGAKNGALLGKGPLFAPQQFSRNSTSSENSRSDWAKGKSASIRRAEKDSGKCGSGRGGEGESGRGAGQSHPSAPGCRADQPEQAPAAAAGRTTSSPRQRRGGLIGVADQSRGHGRGGGWLLDGAANSGSTQPSANGDAEPQGRGRGRGKGRGKGRGGGRRCRRGGKPGDGGDDDGDDDDEPGGDPHPGGDPAPSDPSSSPRDMPPRDPWDRQRNNFAAWVWEQLDDVSLPEVFAQDVVTTVDPPFIIRKDYIQIQGYALQRFYDTHTEEGFGREN